MESAGKTRAGGICQRLPLPKAEYRFGLEYAVEKSVPPLILGIAPELGLGLIARPNPYTWRSTIMRLISAMALAGLRCFGQALAQFRMV